MPRHRWFALVLAVTAAGNQPSPGQAPSSPALTPSELFEKVSPCVVKIVAKDDDGRPIGTGSGFVILPKPDGHPSWRRWIVTNHHVIRAAVSATIDPPFVDSKPPSDLGGIYASVLQVVAENERDDLAVVAGYGTDVPSLPMGDETLPPIGTRILVISSPEGLKNSLSEGLVSGLRERENGEQWIQITAPISPGSSGGPVLTADGKVIGVVVASREDGQNLNFAVPVSALRRLLDAPRASRPLWKGTSIRKEEWDAFDDAWFVSRIQACGDIWPDGWINHLEECDVKVAGKAESGDQLALLLQARDEYRRDSPADCVALATLKRAIAAKPSGWEYLAYYYLGKLTSDMWFCPACILQNKGQFIGPDQFNGRCVDPAVPLLKKSMELNPQFSPSFKQLADVYLMTNRHSDALVTATNLVALAPRCSDAYQIRGRAFAALGNRTGFEDDFKTALSLRPPNAELYHNMGSGYSDLDDWDHAIEAYKSELPYRNDDRVAQGGAYANIARCFDRQADCANAYAAIAKANSLTGRDCSIVLMQCRQRPP